MKYMQEESSFFTETKRQKQLKRGEVKKVPKGNERRGEESRAEEINRDERRGE